MKKAEYKKRIKEQIQVNTELIKGFDMTINCLAQILEERDRVYLEYIGKGAHPVIEFTSDRGAVNLKPNPLLKLWQELNNTALQYFNALGLSAAGLRKLGGQLPEKESGEVSKFDRLRFMLDDDESENEEEPEKTENKPIVEKWRAQYEEAMKKRNNRSEEGAG